MNNIITKEDLNMNHYDNLMTTNENCFMQFDILCGGRKSAAGCMIV